MAQPLWIQNRCLAKVLCEDVIELDAAMFVLQADGAARG
jgi:hypothetical protein